MRVNLGTIEVSDEDRKAYRKARGKSGMATRAELAAAAVEFLQAELSDAHAAIAGSPGPIRPAPAARPTEAPEPSGASRRREPGPKCRHCGMPEGAVCHQFTLAVLAGAHTFNPAPWED